MNVRVIYMLLVGSIALNALLIGFLLVQNQGGVIARFLGNETISIGSKFPAELRAEFREVLRENKTEFSAVLMEARPALREVQSRAREIPFDREGLESATQALSLHLTAIETLLFAYYVEAVSRMPDEVRREWPIPVFPIQNRVFSDVADTDN